MLLQNLLASLVCKFRTPIEAKAPLYEVFLGVGEIYLELGIFLHEILSVIEKAFGIGGGVLPRGVDGDVVDVCCFAEHFVRLISAIVVNNLVHSDKEILSLLHFGVLLCRLEHCQLPRRLALATEVLMAEVLSETHVVSRVLRIHHM